MDARGKFGEHGRSVRVARGVAESNSRALPCTLKLTKSQTRAGVGVGTFPQTLDVYTVYNMQENPKEVENFLNQTRLVKKPCRDVIFYTVMAIDSKESLTG